MNNEVNVKVSSFGFANTYVLAVEDECFIIDPAVELKEIIRMVDNKKVLGVILTHGHYDHFVNLFETLSHYNTKVYMQRDAFSKVNDANLSYQFAFTKKPVQTLSAEDTIFLHDGMSVPLKSKKIKVIQTPGHTSCSISLRIDNILFTGDTLFRLGIGRYDLATANQYKLSESIKKLLSIKDDCIVYPGHDEATSVHFEAKNNPFYLKIK